MYASYACVNIAFVLRRSARSESAATLWSNASRAHARGTIFFSVIVFFST